MLPPPAGAALIPAPRLGELAGRKTPRANLRPARGGAYDTHESVNVMYVGERATGKELQCPEALRLMEDYPDPLTWKQREELRNHTSRLVHRYTTVRKGALVIERGHKSLHALLARLEAERARLQTSLDEFMARTEGPHNKTAINMDNVDSGGDTSTGCAVPADSCPDSEVGDAGATLSGDHHAATCEEKKNEEHEAQTACKKNAGRGRHGGGLLRSAMFANLHSVLTAAKREQQNQQRVSVATERERIAKVTQLKIIEDDIAVQKQRLDPINEKYEKSCTLLECMKEEVVSALRLYDEVQKMEVAYASRFFLRASGSKGSGVEGDDGSSASYDIFFAPAKYTEEVQDMVREQVEEGLGEYLAYRRRVDVVLEKLADERRKRDAARADKLLELIGVDKSSVSMSVPSNVAPSSDAVCEPSSDYKANGDERKTPSSQASYAVFNVEDSEDGDDDEYLNEEQIERRQREQIQSALAALDDFEELY
ncbi:hypothetical protein TRVL_02066 [Trypanosoma vivax]|nr:hypothetical protein TRVL_02066 [Trypanosoma vivax]